MIVIQKLQSISFIFLLLLVCSCTDHLELAKEHTYVDISFANCDEVLENTSAIVGELKSIAQTMNASIENISDGELSRLGSYLGQATFVGLGEATHGSHEFFAIKNRIIKYLAENHDLKAVALEGSWSDGYQINKYLKDGMGSLEEIVKNLPTRVWRAQELVDLFEWMREYNLQNPEQQALSFFGIDLLVSQGEFTMIKSYLSNYAPELQLEMENLISPLSQKITEDQLLQNILSASEKTLLIEHMQTLAGKYEAMSEQLISLSSKEEYEVIKQTFNIIIQAASYIRNDLGNNRDAYMSQNAEWLSDHLGGAKVAIWAHNVHVSQDRLLWIGGQLKLRHGSKYRSVGSSFSSGNFWAYNSLDNTSMSELEEAGCASLNVLYGRVGEQFYMIHDDLVDGSLSKDHLEEYQPFFMVSSTYNPQLSQSELAQSQILESYDAIIHFKSVTFSNLIF